MVDWDEVLEDVNWKRGIALVIAGIIVIVGVVFVLHDYWKFNRISRQLEGDLKDIKRFKETWKKDLLSEEALQEVAAEKKQLEEALATARVRLPVLPEPSRKEKNRFQALIGGAIKELAVSKGVTITRIDWPDDQYEVFCVVSPVEITMSGDQRHSADFLSGLYHFKCPVAEAPDNECPAANKSPAQGLEGSKFIKYEYYSFNEKNWNEANSCDLNVVPPEIKTRPGTSILFGAKLDELRSKVDQEAATMAQVKTAVVKSCEARKARDRVQAELNILKEKKLQ
jgi:Tfp pilus assembly protein PilO